MLHPVFCRYAKLGLRHLATCTGFKSAEQWDFLESVKSMPKSFAFCERLLYAMRVVLHFEFLKSLSNDTRIKVIKSLESPDPEIFEEAVLPLYNEYIIKGYNDEVWTKNFEILESVENIISHYYAERTRNYNLSMASIKEFLPFAMTSN